jgi:acetylornithine deacetylase/succinyl-diaminopimelate desuccinylase-like protein
MTVTRDEVVELLEQLVRIDSTNPWLIEGAVGEGDLAKVLSARLEEIGLEVTLDEVAAGRFNVLARLRGSRPGPTLCINAHIDTVGYTEWGVTALEPRIDGDRMYGRGSADDKAGVVAAMLAAQHLIISDAQLVGDVLLALVIDEEGVSIGTEHLVEHHTMDYAIVIEPTGLPLAITEHQGFGWIDVVVHGRAAHGSAPDVGIDAIVHLAEVITRLHALDEREWKAKPDALNGRTVFHTGTISGGTDYATYPSSAVLGIEIGTQPGETLRDRVADIETIFAEVRETDPNFSGEVVVRLDRDPFTGSGQEPLLAAMDAAAVEVLGVPMERTGENAWTDAALLQSAGVPTLLVGPKGDNYHALDEWVSITEVVQMTDILTRTIRNLLA